jgi:hypothetical protein
MSPFETRAVRVVAAMMSRFLPSPFMTPAGMTSEAGWSRVGSRRSVERLEPDVTVGKADEQRH